jgi:hypothetical protein
MVADGLSYEQVLQNIDIPLYEQWSGIPLREQQLNVMRAFQQSGGTIAEPRLLLTPRRLTHVFGLVWLALATIVVLREYRKYLPPYAHTHAFPAPPVPYRTKRLPRAEPVSGQA